MEVEREQVRLLHILDGGLPREINRLRDRGVAPVLEGGLHSDMPFRRDVVGRREDLLPLLRDFLQAARGPVVVENLLHEVLPPNPSRFATSLESYGTSSMNSIRAKPMTPRPIFRVACVISSISLTG